MKDGAGVGECGLKKKEDASASLQTMTLSGMVLLSSHLDYSGINILAHTDTKSSDKGGSDPGGQRACDRRGDVMRRSAGLASWCDPTFNHRLTPSSLISNSSHDGKQ